jgi:hypothetical protein
MPLTLATSGASHDDAEVAQQQEIENLESYQPDAVISFDHRVDAERSQPEGPPASVKPDIHRRKRSTEKRLAAGDHCETCQSLMTKVPGIFSYSVDKPWRSSGVFHTRNDCLAPVHQEIEQYFVGAAALGCCP